MIPREIVLTNRDPEPIITNINTVECNPTDDGRYRCGLYTRDILVAETTVNSIRAAPLLSFLKRTNEEEMALYKFRNAKCQLQFHPQGTMLNCNTSIQKKK